MLCAMLPPMGAVAHEQEENMKRSILLWLINQLENEVDDDHFWMGAWLAPVNRGGNYEFIHYVSEKSIPHCKTAGCIAGTLFLKLTPEKRREYLERYGENALVEKAAKAELGLNYEQCSALFEPGAMTDIKRQHAIDVLKNLNTNGVINWAVVLPPKVHQQLIDTARYGIEVNITDD